MIAWILISGCVLRDGPVVDAPALDPWVVIPEIPVGGGVFETRELLCQRVDTVVVGTATSRHSTRSPSGLFGSKGPMTSRVVFDVERVLKGASADPLVLQIDGGENHGEFQRDFHVPRMAPGSRYTLYLTTLGVDAPVITRFVELPAVGALPSEATLIATLQARCDGL